MSKKLSHEELIEAIKRGDRETVILSCLGLAKYLARVYTYNHVECDELFSVATVELVKAVEHLVQDPSKTDNPIAYISTTIRLGIFGAKESLRNLPVGNPPEKPYHQHECSSAAYQDLFIHYGFCKREPFIATALMQGYSNTEIAKTLGVSAHWLRKLIHKMQDKIVQRRHDERNGPRR